MYPDADDDVEPVAPQAARQPPHVPRPGHPQLLLGDQRARTRVRRHLRGQPGKRSGNRVVVLAVHPLTQQVVRSEALGTMPATGVEHPRCCECVDTRVQCRLDRRRAGFRQTDVQVDIRHAHQRGPSRRPMAGG